MSERPGIDSSRAMTGEESAKVQDASCAMLVWYFACRIRIQYQNGSAFNHCDVQSQNDRARSTTPSLLRRGVSSHPSIGQVLNNIRPQNVLTELLLLDQIQRLESGARISTFMSAPLVSLEGQ
jgi:hypothetical protein